MDCDTKHEELKIIKFLKENIGNNFVTLRLSKSSKTGHAHAQSFWQSSDI